MPVLSKEYVASITKFNKPEVKTDQDAIALLLLRLLILEPGSDPLHPDMGVGIRKYRYTMGSLEELETRITEQIRTFLPCFPNASVSVYITDGKVLKADILVNGIVYTYDSSMYKDTDLSSLK